MYMKIKKGRKTITSEIAYIAGFFDGEGCIRIKKANQKGNSYYVIAHITNSNKEILEYIQRLFGGQIRQQEKTPNKTIYQYMITSAEATDMLITLDCFLIEKEEQARLAIKFHINNSQLSNKEKEEFYWKMRELKNRNHRQHLRKSRII